MLPTNEKAVIGFLTQKGKKRGNLVHFDKSMPNILDSENQHLYFLSDEKIKEGDWIIVNNEDVIQMKSSYDNDMTGEDIWVGDSLNGYATYKDNCKKIIATTDKSLTFHYTPLDRICKTCNGLCKGYITSLPQPSQSFIKKFVEEYNKGNIITEVMVEYEIATEILFKVYEPDPIKLKINPKDNTITIHKIKDSWNIEEVKQLCWQAFINFKCIDGNYIKPSEAEKLLKTFNKWIEENL